MDAFLRDMAEGPRKIAVVGHFGTGKTEFAVSLAFALAAEGINPASRVSSRGCSACFATENRTSLSL